MIRRSFIYGIWLVMFCIHAVNAQWTQTEIPYFGDVYISSLLTTDNAIIVGTSGYGIFISTDNGATWHAADSSCMIESISALAVTDGALFAAGIDDRSGNAVFRSTDNGTNWVPVTPDTTGHHDISAFAVNGGIIFAGSSMGVFRSADNGESWTEINSGFTDSSWINSLAVKNGTVFAGGWEGVFYSTNNGENWKLADSGITGVAVMSLAVNGATLLAGTRGNGVFVSENGNSWTQANSEPTDARVYSFTVKNDTVYAGTANNGILISIDNGRNWTAITSNPTSGNILELAVYNGVIYTGTSAGLFFSEDNGSSWSEVVFHVPEKDVKTVFAAGGTLIAGKEGAVLHSTDNGVSWLPTVSGLSGRFDPICFVQNGSIIYMGTYDYTGTSTGLFFSNDNGATWEVSDSGFVSSLAACNGTVIAGIDGELKRSTDNGISWTTVDSGLSLIDPRNGLLKKIDVSMYVFSVIGSTFFMGPRDYISRIGIFRSTDNGISWNLMVDSSFCVCGPFAESGNHLIASCVRYSPSTDGTDPVYIKGICLSTDTGKTWTMVDSGFTSWVSSFLAYDDIVFAGIYNDGILVSADNGRSWTPVNEGFPSGFAVHSLTECGGNLFVGTVDDGVWQRPISEMTGVIKRRTLPEPVQQPVFQIRLISHTGSNITFEVTLLRSEMVTVTMYDLAGREVTTIVKRHFNAGTYHYSLHARARGCYMLKCKAGKKNYIRLVQIMR